jgi:malonate decarboxylase epsilon subunit
MNLGTLAFLYPGQGSQMPGMLAALPNTNAVQETIVEAADTLGGIHDTDTEAALESTTNSQLALLICGVAATRTFVVDYGIGPGFAAGHSVGAFTAAVTAGVLTLTEALTAVRLRGELMRQACASGDWGMAAVNGLRLRAVRDLLAALGVDGDELWIANVNSATQVVLAGTATALAEARQAAQRLGARSFQPLDVHIASHGPVQSGTARALAANLAEVPARPQTAAYFTNIGARLIRDDPRAVVEDLAEGVAHPVRWLDIARLLPEFGVTAAVQMPPGNVLARLTNAASPDLTTFDTADDEIGAIAARLGAHTRGSPSPRPPGCASTTDCG